MNKLDLKTRARILGCLVEGNSIRSTCRMTGAAKNTVVKLLMDVGAGCDLYQYQAVRNLRSKRLQCDEIWSFVYAKAANAAPEMKSEGTAGDVWTWTALDADSKLIVSWAVGHRDMPTATSFMKDVASRLSNRVQLTTDGLHTYLNAVEAAFEGTPVDYAILHKLYGTDKSNSPERRYSPAKCLGTVKGTALGDPDPKHVSTSYVERQNLTMRMSIRRFTRLTNAFSKKVENHAHAVALHFMHYNFARIHQSLRVTPAMEAGISDHVWSLEEIAALADLKIGAGN